MDLFITLALIIVLFEVDDISYIHKYLIKNDDISYIHKYLIKNMSYNINVWVY